MSDSFASKMEEVCVDIEKEHGKQRKDMRKINILYLFCIIATLYTEIVSKV